MILIKALFKKLISIYGYWIFAIVFGILLIFWEDEKDIEPFFSISAFIYWSLLIFWAGRWLFTQIRTTLKLKKEKKQMELLHLQSQVNPHFFFNMLNNLYGLVGKDSEKAQQLILKLSEMMRYSIYDGQKQAVTLKEEVDYLKSYIELHKMRYHTNIDIEFKIEIEDEQFELTPLLFIILLENAFKHGIENLREHAFIKVILTATKKEARFEVRNNFDPSQRSQQDGIGLKNLRRRLELVYPKNHEFSILEDKNMYTAKLKIGSL